MMTDTGVLERLDTLLEDEIRVGYRVKEIPANIREFLDPALYAGVTHLRLWRLNQARRKRINQLVHQRYHKDLANKDILSQKQIMDLVKERGEWTDADTKRREFLNKKTTQDMSDLFDEGISDAQWGFEYLEQCGKFRKLVEASDRTVEEKAAMIEIFDRWSQYMPSSQEQFDVLYAAAQGRDKYSVDKDQQDLLTKSTTEMAELLQAIDELRDRLTRYAELTEERFELLQLNERFAKIFAESVESRRDATEEMARVYFSTEWVVGKESRPIAPDFDQLYDLHDKVLEWLVTENYLFQNGIVDEARRFMETFGFLPATQEAAVPDQSPTPPVASAPSASAASGESPEAPLFKQDLPPRPGVPSASSA